MDLTSWAFYAFIAAAVTAAAFLHYRRREPRGRGRRLLAGLRALALSLLVLLLFDPRVPTAAGGGGGATLVLLDRSLSMRLPADGGVTRWEAARAAAAELATARVLGFGGGDVSAVAGSGTAPDATTSRLAPALRAAAEAGAARVLVVTDRGIEDWPEARGLADRLGARLEVRTVGGELADNAGIVAAETSPWLEVGEEAVVRVEVAGLRGAADSAMVVLRRGDRELARARVEVPPAGRVGTASLRFTPRSPSPEPVRLDVALEGADAIAADDVRSVYVRISEEPAGVALVSFRPDQEPRFLLPVLERVLGLPTRGWMALAGDRYIRLGAGREAGLAGDEAEVRRALAEADLVVLHGLGPAAPAWARQGATEARRVLIFPADAGLDALPFPVGPARPADWYPSPDVPPSPVAALMAGVEPGDAPPLTALRTPDPPAGFWAPLAARPGRRGQARPVLLAGTAGERRVAVALGDGYWRWAFAGGASRELYDRLWSAVGGWLFRDAERLAAGAIRPVARAVPRGEPPRFTAPAGADSLRIRLERGDTAVVDAVLPVADGVVTVAVQEPGHYRYSAEAVAGVSGGGDGERASGPLTVESFSPEFTRPPVVLDLDGVAMAEAGAARRAAAGRPTRPLRTSPWPYVALVLLLCTEWVLRRRWGLR